MDYRQLIDEIIAENRAKGPSVSSQVRHEHFLESMTGALSRIQPEPFLEWVRDDRELSAFFWDVQQSGACAKPREAAALIVEAIVMDAIEE